MQNHFPDIRKMVNIGSGSTREIKDYASKPMVATGQTYFAIQTRRQELADTQPQLNEDKKGFFCAMK